MKKNYLCMILCLLSWALKSQNKHAEEYFKERAKNSSALVPKIQIVNDCNFFGGDTLLGFPLSAEIDNLVNQNEDYTELKLSIKKKEIDFVKNKYKIEKLPFEFVKTNENSTLSHHHYETPNSFAKNGSSSTQASTCNNIDFE